MVVQFVKPTMGDILLQMFFLQTSMLILLFPHATSLNIVKFIPGFPGDLPFYLETGYIGVGEDEEVQLFYYFIKSERDPVKDPLMIWLTGGPGCSAFSGLVLEIVSSRLSKSTLTSTVQGQTGEGTKASDVNVSVLAFESGPLIFNTSACNWHSKFPTYQLNPFSWTKVASIIFLDSPVGTGFSYATKQEGYNSDDITSSRHIYQFLRKWLVDHVGFQNNLLYVSGDSYCGKVVPLVVQEISDGNKAGFQPIMNLQGYVLGNPFTWKEDDTKAKFKYAHRVSLISDELYQSTMISCNGKQEDLDLENVSCTYNLQAISNNLDPLFTVNILKPKCISNETWCQDSMYQLLEYWANDIQVQEALQIQQGTKPYWIRCNRTLAYDSNVESTVGYHQNYTQDFMHALIYSGDQDLRVSYVGTLKWIRMLNISITQDWKPWFVNDQVAGYTMKFSNDRYHLTFATVKGAGHTAPEYRRPECFTMFVKWLAMIPL